MIKIDMEKPVNCNECVFRYISIGAMEYKCILNRNSHDVSFESRDNVKPDWCPLNDEIVKIIEPY